MLKKFLLAIFLINILLSCSGEGVAHHEKYPQKWVLVKMSGQMMGSETTGEEMYWQEYYLFYENGKFTKHRELDGLNTEASGKFERIENLNEILLELNYDNQSEIVGSCSGNQSETLWLKSNEVLFSTWLQCDGPGLEYTREF